VDDLDLVSRGAERCDLVTHALPNATRVQFAHLQRAIASSSFTIHAAMPVGRNEQA
jgi:hypothetical protein